MPSSVNSITKREGSLFDSFDFDDCESRVYLKDRHQSFVEQDRWGNRVQWLLIFQIAIATACVGFLLTRAVLAIQIFKFNLMHQLIDEKISWSLIYLVYVVINALLVAVAACLTIFLEPVIKGSGIPEIKCMLNGIKVPRVVRFKTLLLKCTGIVFAVSSGLPCGMEGPMIHAGAVLASGISQGKSTTLGFDTSWTKYRMFRNDASKRDFIACGAAAGVATAFGAPIGGVLFALEEGCSFWHYQLTIWTFFCASIASATIGILGSFVNPGVDTGHLADNGMFKFGSFTSQNNEMTYYLYEIPAFMVMGCLGGIMGAIFNGCNKKISIKRRELLVRKRMKLIEALIMSLLVSSVGFLVPLYFLNSCEVIPKDTVLDTRSFVRFGCPNKYYSPSASIFFSPLDVALKSLFHSMNFSVHYLIVTILYLCFFFVLSCLNYGIHVPSGLFVPTLLLGAAFGRLVGEAFTLVMPQGSTVDPGTYALIGAAAMLGGMARMTISLTVILVEATGDVQYILPLMLTLIVAKFVGDHFNEGLYDIHIELQKLPFLHWHPHQEAKLLLVSQVMTSKVVFLPEVLTAGSLLHILQSCDHSNFPVISDEKGGGNFRGVIAREFACRLLQKKAFFAWRPIPYQAKEHLDWRTLHRVFPRYPNAHNIQLSTEEAKMWVDLTPYMNPTPYTIFEDAPVERAFKLFRHMGLRFMLVLKSGGDVAGVVTRTDLLAKNCQQRIDRLFLPDNNYTADSLSFVRNIDSVPSSPESQNATSTEVSPLNSDFEGKHKPSSRTNHEGRGAALTSPTSYYDEE